MVVQSATLPTLPSHLCLWPSSNPRTNAAHNLL
jgi:hypothetical protein